MLSKYHGTLELELIDRKYAKPPLPPPHVLQTLVPDSPAFVDLIKAEQKLDWTLLRKKAEINDTLGRPVRVSLIRHYTR
jgi:SWI/SNF-related matrix-associated actin-dependent regulator of chromatin subfamily D